MDFDKLAAAATLESEKQLEYMDALIARRGKRAAHILRRVAELAWLMSSMKPPLEAMKEDPEEVEKVIEKLQSAADFVLSCLYANAIEAVNGRDMSREELEAWAKEVELITDAITRSEMTIAKAGGAV